MSNTGKELMKAIRKMSDIDFSQTANARFMGKFRRALISKGFSVPTAEHIAAALDVKLSPSALDESELDEAAVIYAGMISKLERMFRDQGFVNVEEVLKSVAAQMTLHCD